MSGSVSVQRLAAETGLRLSVCRPACQPTPLVASYSSALLRHRSLAPPGSKTRSFGRGGNLSGTLHLSTSSLITRTHSMSTTTMTAPASGQESSYVAADMWSMFEESGLDDLAASFIRPHSSPTRHTANSTIPSTAASPSALRHGASLLAALDDHVPSHSATPLQLSADFLISPLRPSPFGASPGAFLRPQPPSRLTSPFQPYSPMLGNYDPLQHSPSLRIMKQFQSASTSSSLSSYSPSPSRTAFSPLRSPFLPSAYLGSFGSYRGGKSAFEPQLYTSPTVKQERMSPSSVMRIPVSLQATLPSPLHGRVDGLQSIEEDDVTASSFPSLSSLSTLSSHSTAFSSVRSEGVETAEERAKSEFASSSLSALSGLIGRDSALSSLKRGRPPVPSSPPSRTKRFKRHDSIISTGSSSTSPTPLSSSSLKSDPHQRQQKGLRHFSLKVCEKVEQQGVTTYNNVADELVADLANEPFDEDEDDGDEGGDGGSSSKKKKSVKYDEKNVRRRVYDALNVLTAMGIIVKEKKKITWIGLPGGVSQTVGKLADEKRAREQRLKEKRNHLQELLVYVVALKNLKQRNIAALTTATPAPSSPTSTAAPSTTSATASTSTNALSLQHDHIPLRFVLIKTAASHIVHLSVSPDQTELQCDVSGPFVLHDESEVLKGMGLASIDGFDLPYLIPREICSFYPDKYIKRGGSTVDVGRVDEAVGGRIGPGTVSLGGNKRK